MNVNVTLWLYVPPVAILIRLSKILGGGEQMIERAIRGLMRQDNSLYIFSDRPLLNTVIVKMKNPFHKTTAMFIMSLCGSAAFLLSYHGIFLL